MDSDLDEAAHIVNGAGLLRREGEVLRDWKVEGLNAEAFTNARHPRTMVGVDREGFIWLAAVDGRQPTYSIGMTFDEMQRLCDRLGLVSALNLDGGGSTTMVVKGQIVNRPSDPAGARPVSDAILVTLAIARPFRMSTMTDLQSHLAAYDADAWQRAVGKLSAEIHPIDREATLIWFAFYPLELHVTLAETTDKEGTARRLGLMGTWQLADQIDSSHRFFYAHRYWPQVKLAVQNAEAPFADGPRGAGERRCHGRRAPRPRRSRVPARHLGGRAHDLPAGRRGRLHRRARPHPSVREGAGHVPASGVEEARSR